MIELAQKRINELIRKEEKLDALEAAGVDNWDHYDDALKGLREEREIEEIIREFVERDLQENFLVDHVDVEYPSSVEAGPSVQLTGEGEEEMVRHLRIHTVRKILEIVENREKY